MKKREFPVYKELIEAYDFYNKELFNNELPYCMITLSKKHDSFGIFYPNSFVKNEDDKVKMHEISMNVEYFAVRPLELTLSTLVHEMCHLKQYEEKSNGRSNYHNKRFAEIMKSCGLITSTTGTDKGNSVGQSMNHYIETNGKFEKKTRELINKGYLIPFVAMIGRDIKSFKLNEIKKMVVPGKKDTFKNKDGTIFKGKSVRCGMDKKGNEIFKVIVEEEDKNRRVTYKCKCGDYTILGKRGLKLTCNVCNKMLKVVGD